MNILFVASECAPFVKTGGLADVIGAVPKALENLGSDVRIMLPAYPALQELVDNGKEVLRLGELFGGPARLMAIRSNDLNLLLLDAPHLFDRQGSIYLNEIGEDWHDNHLRFGALCVAAARVGTSGLGKWKPDIVHAHDWQAGLVPLLIKLANSESRPKFVLTVHNIAFQGLFDWSVKNIFDIPDEHFTAEGAEYWGHLGFLKAGLVFADKITTVSPTYAQELLQPEFGMGLEGVLQSRKDDLTGIINGIDLDVWNPKTDPALKRNYTNRSLARKAKNRTELEKRFGLETDQSAPLFCVVSRLTQQKGLDLLLEVLPDLMNKGAQLVVLGSGEKELETGFSNAAQQFEGRVGTVIGYDEKLSHLMQGGSDAILVPSRFEPCGLTQLYGLRYGTLPVVAKTGGLADTVVHADQASIASKKATGVQFHPITANALRDALNHACDLFADKKAWKSLQLNAMRVPVGWDQSAPEYMALYKSLTAH